MPESEESVDPTREEEVRRLLAEARHTDPMPAAVTARLGAVLSDMRATGGANAGADAAALAAPPETDADPDHARVVSLAAHRRRRRAGALLAAAAVVVVGALGVGRLVSSAGGDGAGSSAGGAADRAAADSTQSRTVEGGSAAAQAPPASTPGGSTPSPEPSAGAVNPKAYQSRVPVVVRPDHFAADVASARAVLSAETTAATRTPADRRVQQCAPVAGRGQVVAVRYDGDAGVLVLRPPSQDTQVVELYLCGAPHPVRSVTLPRH